MLGGVAFDLDDEPAGVAVGEWIVGAVGVAVAGLRAGECQEGVDGNPGGGLPGEWVSTLYDSLGNTSLET
jgi:hypothetical protein